MTILTFMNVDGAFILAETCRKTSVLRFVYSRFRMILTSLGRCLSHVSHWHMPFKKTNKSVTEHLTSNSALGFETWCRELVQRCLNNSHAICACIRKHNILQFIY